MRNGGKILVFMLPYYYNICVMEISRLNKLKSGEHTMRRITDAVFTVLLSAALIGNCFAAESSARAVKLIKAARMYIEQGEKEKAVATLDTAFLLADSAGDHNSLMEIGDLYIAADPSQKEKALKAWTAAGHWKTALP